MDFRTKLLIFICGLFGHKKYIEDIGGAGYQVCENCAWTGRVIYDLFADEKRRLEIKELNKKGLLK